MFSRCEKFMDGQHIKLPQYYGIITDQIILAKVDYFRLLNEQLSVVPFKTVQDQEGPNPKEP